MSSSAITLMTFGDVEICKFDIAEEHVNKGSWSDGTYFICRYNPNSPLLDKDDVDDYEYLSINGTWHNHMGSTGGTYLKTEQQAIELKDKISL